MDCIIKKMNVKKLYTGTRKIMYKFIRDVIFQTLDFAYKLTLYIAVYRSLNCIRQIHVSKYYVTEVLIELSQKILDKIISLYKSVYIYRNLI